MDDATAIRRCRKGEQEAFRRLVEVYQRQAVAHAAAILGNREDARDAVQDAFVDAFRALKNFDESRAFYPWFYVLLRNRCYKAVGRRRETENVEDVVLVAPRSGPANEETVALESALLLLDREDREIVMLKYFDGLSYDELAERLNIPRGTVMSRLFHARRKLREVGEVVMKEIGCEEVLIAKMAALDGEPTAISPDDADSHLAVCENCRLELAGLRRVDQSFELHVRREHDADLWPAVQKRIEKRTRAVGWQTFAIFAVALVAFRIAEMSSGNDIGWLLGLVPLVLAALLFVLLRENPFKVRTDLVLESE